MRLWQRDLNLDRPWLQGGEVVAGLLANLSTKGIIHILYLMCKDKNLFAMLDTVVAWPVAWLRLTHRHHLLLALLLELNLETIVLVVVCSYGCDYD